MAEPTTAWSPPTPPNNTAYPALISIVIYDDPNTTYDSPAVYYNGFNPTQGSPEGIPLTMWTGTPN